MIGEERKKRERKMAYPVWVFCLNCGSKKLNVTFRNTQCSPLIPHCWASVCESPSQQLILEFSAVLLLSWLYRINSVICLKQDFWGATLFGGARERQRDTHALLRSSVPEGISYFLWQWTYLCFFRGQKTRWNNFYFITSLRMFLCYPFLSPSEGCILLSSPRWLNTDFS